MLTAVGVIIRILALVGKMHQETNELYKGIKEMASELQHQCPLPQPSTRLAKATTCRLLVFSNGLNNPTANNVYAGTDTINTAPRTYQYSPQNHSLMETIQSHHVNADRESTDNNSVILEICTLPHLVAASKTATKCSRTVCSAVQSEASLSPL